MKKYSNYWLAVPCAVAMVLGLPSLPSSAVRLDAPAPPSVEDVQMVEELAAWVYGEEAIGRTYAGLEPSLLGQQVTPGRQSFDLFRSFNEAEEHRTILSELPYGELIESISESVGVDGLLVAAVIQAESGFNPRVVSSAGALGLMQLMPATAAQYGNFDPMNPHDNVRAGARYLRDLLAEFDGEIVLALAAYNAGPGNVRRYDGVPPFSETQTYVDRVLSTYIGYHRSLWQETQVAELLGQVTVN